MRTALLFAASATALGLAACGPKIPPARAALDCPGTQGELTRTSVSPDGKACTYSTGSGAEVTLQLVSVQGSVDSTLSQIEANLLAGRKEKAAAETAAAKPAEASQDAAKTQGEAAKAEAEAETDAKAGVQVKVDADGKTEVVTEHGGETRVNLPGIHIVANDDTDTANVQVGPIHVNAGGETATVRVGPRNVRLRGEPLNPDRRGVRAMFLYKGDDLPDGYRFVGYEAGGPRRGPITVAVVKAKSIHDDDDDIYNDVKKLVRKNGGV
jgi:hypothetical protein